MNYIIVIWIKLCLILVEKRWCTMHCFMGVAWCIHTWRKNVFGRMCWMWFLFFSVVPGLVQFYITSEESFQVWWATTQWETGYSGWGQHLPNQLEVCTRLTETEWTKRATLLCEYKNCDSTLPGSLNLSARAGSSGDAP